MERGNIKTYPLSSAYADTFPATVGFFALFSLRRKSEKGESKKEYRHNGTGEACQKGKERTWVEYEAFQEKESSPG